VQSYRSGVDRAEHVRFLAMALTAKYATTCSVCRRPIRPGDRIVSAPGVPRGAWAHEACPDTLDLAGPRPETPDLFATTPTTQTPEGTEHVAGGTGTPSATTGQGLLVYTDGACSGNPGPGGWAWATVDGQQASGGQPLTTNQRMEIAAALRAVDALPGELVVVSDSSYVVNCFRDGWWRGWLARGWVNSQRKPVANRDLWQPLVELVQARGNVTFRWVKGHSGDPMNDLVDRLAVEAGRLQASGTHPHR